LWRSLGLLKYVGNIKQPDHEEYESYIEWLGGVFDPERFDKDQVNEKFRTKDYGCIELDD